MRGERSREGLPSRAARWHCDTHQAGDWPARQASEAGWCCNEMSDCMGKAYEACDAGSGCTADDCSGTKGCVHKPTNDGAVLGGRGAPKPRIRASQAGPE